MTKEKTAKEKYDESANQGLYEEAVFEKEVVAKVITMALEDYEYGKRLRKEKEPNWRVLFNIHYDALRELCDQLMHCERQKTSKHQALFAFIIVHFSQLHFDWMLLERIRTARNFNKYQGLDISEKMWKEVEFQFDLYISALGKELKKKLDT